MPRRSALHGRFACTFVFIAMHALAPVCAAQSSTPSVANGGGKDVDGHVAALMRQGRAALRSQDWFSALRAFAQARQWHPQDPAIAQAIADVLVEINAPQGAALALGDRADIGVRARQAAALVRWGHLVPPLDPRRPHAGTDAAIGRLQALVAEALQAHPVDSGLVTRLRRDLVVALRNRERWADALAMAQALRDGGDTLPPYVREAEADALLASRRPEEARVAYQEVLLALPGRREALTGRFYAEVESEDFAAAWATVDQLAAARVPWKVVGGDTRPSPDPAWLEAQLLAAQARRYGDVPGEAWRRIEPLARVTPASPEVRVEAGEAAAARGWVRRGHEDILIAHSLSPENPWIQLALADSEFRRRRWNASQACTDRVEATLPGNARLEYRNAELDAYRMPELRMDIRPRVADEGSDEGSGDGISASLRLLSPPLHERWRMLGAAERETGNPSGTPLARNRYGAGLEGRWPDVTLELVAWSNTGELSHGGFDARVQWWPDDHWSLDASVQAFTSDTPLRAIEAGIRADKASVGVAYAWHESLVASVSAAVVDFTDGNRRVQGTADIALAVVDKPHLDVALRPSFYASRNSLGDQVPYFNPRRDASFTLGADATHMLWRRYERSLSQTLSASAGGYWQDGFGTAGVGHVTYMQTYQHAPRTAWDYGLSWSHRVYDGDAERALAAFVTLNTRF